MSLLKKSLIAPSLAILLATNLYSANYTVDTTNATKAIEKISELSNIPFIVDTNIFLTFSNRHPILGLIK